MKHSLAILCSAALLSTAALAEDKPSTKDPDMFGTLDADGDGKISKTEATGNEDLARNFDTLDGNSDGYVTKREFRRNTMPKPKPAY